MANRLKMALIDTILTLHGQGWSQRRIARELQIDRETVSRHLELAAPKPATPNEALGGAKPAMATKALGGGEAPKPATPTEGSEAPSGEAPSGEAPSGEAPSGEAPSGEAPSGAEANGAAAVDVAFSSAREASSTAASAPFDGSQCAPYRAIILAKLEQGLSAQRIWQDLVREHGFPHRYHSVRRYVAQLNAGKPLPFRRLESTAGEEVQVDFGQGAWVEMPEGKRRRPHVFRLVLSHSRKGYSEVVWRQTSDDFLRCLENAFWHFGGVPRRIVLDNFKAAVLQPDWFDPELHPKLVAFAAHYGCVFLPTKPRTPRHKGKVERGIDYVQENALKGRSFAGLNEQNEFLARWEEEVADARVHGTTRRVVGEHFRAVEQQALLPLPVARFANFREARRTVHRDGHIEVDKAFYSVPPEYLGHEVWVRWDGRLVRLFNHRLEQIAVHVQRQPGQFSTDERHLASEKINAVERGAAYLLGKARRLGTGCAQWAEAMLAQRGIEGLRVLQGLLHLADKHPREALGRACAAAHGHGEYRLRTLRALLKRQEVHQPLLDFMHEHPLIRPMSDYGQFVRAALHREKPL